MKSSEKIDGRKCFLNRSIFHSRVDSKTLNLTRFAEPVECFCDECKSENNYYECKGCSRTIPWCFGASDEWWEYCDNCYCVITLFVVKA